MKNSAHQGVRFIAPLPLIIFLSLFVSCVSNNTSNQVANKNNNTSEIAEAPARANDDAEELARKIKLPLTPDELFWVEEAAAKTGVIGPDGIKNIPPSPDPNTKMLIAVLKFSDVNSDALTSQVQKIAPPQDVSIEPEEWFPAELIAESETAGDQSLKGKQYSAQDFLQPPYIKGRLIKLEQRGYFVLELSTF